MIKARWNALLKARRLVVVAWLGPVSLVSACGLVDYGDEPSASGGPSTGHNRGESGAGSAGESGTSGSSSGDHLDMNQPARDTRVGACRVYYESRCVNLMRCAGGSDTETLERCAATAIDVCPDFLFSEGANYTIEGALACAEEWNHQDCDAMSRHEFPECSQLAGNLKDGAACAYLSQCQHKCALGLDFCGTCVPLAGSEPCDESRVENDCPEFQACSDGACSDSSYFFTDAERAGWPRQTLGEPCTDDCPSGFFCADADATGETQICQAAPRVGEKCMTNSQGGIVNACGYYLVCGPDSTCQERPLNGEPCALAFRTSLRCGEETECIDEICVGPEGPGKSCLFDGSDTAMEDSDGRCLPGQLCHAGTCFLILPWNQTGCEDGLSRCEHGTKCEDDLCVVDEEPGDYEKACGG